MIPRILLVAACLAATAGTASAGPLRYFTYVFGGNSVDTDTSSVPAVSSSVSASGVPQLYGTVDWDVSATTENGVLRANIQLNSTGNNPGNVPSGVGGGADAVIDDTIYLARGSGFVTLSFSLELTGACTGSGGTNANGSAKSTCAVRSVVALAGYLLELTDPGTGTKGHGINVPGGIGDYALQFQYSLNVQASATDGFASGDFSHSARLFISSPVPFRTESGFSYAPVPEPSKAALLSGSALMLLVVGSRRVSRARRGC